MRRRRHTRLVALLLLLWPLATRAVEPHLVVVVHPTRTEPLDVADVARIFLGRRRFWADGTAIVPLNLPPAHPLRDRFTRVVLHQDATQLARYWNERYFQGVLPPAVLGSTEAVKRYVATEPKAIGYLDATEVDATVHVVLRLD